MSAPVSVVIPAYNAEAWLARALDSVHAQTRVPVEAIVVDDGSTDGTAQVTRRYGPSVHYVFQHNAGVAAARNRGIAESTQEWIAFLDADDEWLPHKTERQLAILADDPRLRWCACTCELVAAGSPAVDGIPDKAAGALGPRAALSFFEAARRQLPLQTSGFIVRRSVLTETGGFDAMLRVSEDRDLWCRIAMSHPELGYCAAVCYRYFLNTPASLTKGAAERTAVVRNLCRNLERSQALGPAVAAAVYGYARGTVIDYLVRAAGREVAIEPEVLQEARHLFQPSLSQRLVMAALRRLPAPWAARVVHRLSR